MRRGINAAHYVANTDICLIHTFLLSNGKIVFCQPHDDYNLRGLTAKWSNVMAERERERERELSLIQISEPTTRSPIS